MWKRAGFPSQCVFASPVQRATKAVPGPRDAQRTRLNPGHELCWANRTVQTKLPRQSKFLTELSMAFPQLLDIFKKGVSGVP